MPRQDHDDLKNPNIERWLASADLRSGIGPRPPTIEPLVRLAHGHYVRPSDGFTVQAYPEAGYPFGLVRVAWPSTRVEYVDPGEGGSDDRDVAAKRVAAALGIPVAEPPAESYKGKPQRCESRKLGGHDRCQLEAGHGGDHRHAYLLEPEDPEGVRDLEPPRVDTSERPPWREGDADGSAKRSLRPVRYAPKEPQAWANIEPSVCGSGEGRSIIVSTFTTESIEDCKALGDALLDTVEAWLGASTRPDVLALKSDAAWFKKAYHQLRDAIGVPDGVPLMGALEYARRRREP
jgi:hypothetical protein